MGTGVLIQVFASGTDISLEGTFGLLGAKLSFLVINWRFFKKSYFMATAS